MSNYSQSQFEYERVEAVAMMLGAVVLVSKDGDTYLVRTTSGEAGGLPVHHEEFFDRWGRPAKTKNEAILTGQCPPEWYNGA